MRKNHRIIPSSKSKRKIIPSFACSFPLLAPLLFSFSPGAALSLAFENAALRAKRAKTLACDEEKNTKKKQQPSALSLFLLLSFFSFPTLNLLFLCFSFFSPT